MKFLLRTLPLIAILTASIGLAQVATGTPSFNSFGGGPFDSVNLGNLNVHFAVPVIHKAGRGMPFIYDLAYDSSIWTPVTSGSVTQWSHLVAWGWTQQTAALSGYVTASDVETRP